MGVAAPDCLPLASAIQGLKIASNSRILASIIAFIGASFPTIFQAVKLHFRGHTANIEFDTISILSGVTRHVPTLSDHPKLRQ